MIEKIKGTWKEKHRDVIEDVLVAINFESDKYILKGGTSLMECYGLNRFSEDNALDGLDRHKIFDIIDVFAKDNGYSYRIAKNTDTTSRFMIDYGGVSEYGNKPLKVEVSYRKKSIDTSERTIINGINVYTINSIALMKANAYSSRDKIRDLFDLTYIVNEKLDELDKSTIFVIKEALGQKGLKQFDYITKTQSDDLIDIKELEEGFLTAFDTLDLFADRNDNIDIGDEL